MTSNAAPAPAPALTLDERYDIAFAILRDLNLTTNQSEIGYKLSLDASTAIEAGSPNAELLVISLERFAEGAQQGANGGQTSPATQQPPATAPVATQPIATPAAPAAAPTVPAPVATTPQPAPTAQSPATPAAPAPVHQQAYDWSAMTGQMFGQQPPVTGDPNNDFMAALASGFGAVNGRIDEVSQEQGKQGRRLTVIEGNLEKVTKRQDKIDQITNWSQVDGKKAVLLGIGLGLIAGFIAYFFRGEQTLEQSLLWFLGAFGLGTIIGVLLFKKPTPNADNTQNNN